jgi:hypothetical protein
MPVDVFVSKVEAFFNIELPTCLDDVPFEWRVNGDDPEQHSWDVPLWCDLNVHINHEGKGSVMGANDVDEARHAMSTISDRLTEANPDETPFVAKELRMAVTYVGNLPAWVVKAYEGAIDNPYSNVDKYNTRWVKKSRVNGCSVCVGLLKKCKINLEPNGRFHLFTLDQPETVVQTLLDSVIKQSRII